MAKSHRKTSQVKPVDRDNIARAVFAAAESMGITDRNMLEGFTGQVMQRLEAAQPLPGMEGFVSSHPKYPISPSQLQEIVSEVLTADEFSPQASSQVVSGIELSDNSLRVLKKRYLKRNDVKGKLLKHHRICFVV